jgi:hypothetical protein
MCRKHVFTGEPRHDNIECSRKHDKARHRSLTRLEQNLSGPNCSQRAMGPDSFDLGWGQNGEGLGPPVGCAYRWLHRLDPLGPFLRISDFASITVWIIEGASSLF